MSKGSLATLTAVVVAVVVAFGVAAPTGSASRPLINRACFEAPSTANTGAPSSAFLSMLGVLRRPQRPSDDLELSLLSHVGEGVYVNYIRLARVVAGTSYYLIPVAKPNCSGPEELLLNERSPGGFASYGGATAAHIADGKLFGTCCKGPTAVVAGVVPDRVAKVSITYPKSGRLHAVTITTKPVENVFVVTVPRESTVAAVPKSVIWRSAKGKVIKTTHG
jgi:hypothetical protein